MLTTPMGKGSNRGSGHLLPARRNRTAWAVTAALPRDSVCLPMPAVLQTGGEINTMLGRASGSWLLPAAPPASPQNSSMSAMGGDRAGK